MKTTHPRMAFTLAMTSLILSGLLGFFGPQDPITGGAIVALIGVTLPLGKALLGHQEPPQE